MYKTKGREENMEESCPGTKKDRRTLMEGSFRSAEEEGTVWIAAS